MDNEERELLNKIGEKVNKLIDKMFGDYYDRAFFEFRLTCDLLDDNFNKAEEISLLDDSPINYCIFCRTPTQYYDKKRDFFLCVRHFKELEEK